MIKSYNYVPFLDDGEKVVYNNYYFWAKAFSPEECDKIIALGNKLHVQDAIVEGASHNTASPEQKMRRSKISWIQFNNDSAWIYEKLHDFAVATNKNMNWNFSLYGFIDQLQFTEYSSQYKGHYDYHSDIVTSSTIRKMSVVVQLSDDNNYEGGDFEMFHVGKVPRERGTLIFFPSFVVHRVLPVTNGTRHSLVAWIAGPKFV
jgi:PKHD-type hydroxylase